MKNYGWVCPKCERCYAPTTLQCFVCGEPTEKEAAVLERKEKKPRLSFGRIDDK